MTSPDEIWQVRQSLLVPVCTRVISSSSFLPHQFPFKKIGGYLVYQTTFFRKNIMGTIWNHTKL